MNFKKNIFLVSLICLSMGIMFLGCSPKSDNISSSDLSNTTTMENYNQPSTEKATPIPGKTSMPSPNFTEEPTKSSAPIDEPAKIQVAIPLKFDKVVSVQQIQSLDKSLIKEIYKEKAVDNMKAFIFLKADDEEFLHGGLDANGISYDLGKISMVLLPQDISLVSINTTELCGKKLLRFDGIMGANAAQSNYFLLKDGKLAPFLSTDGNVKEVDIDSDGKKEIISSSGTSAYTYIYKCKDNYIAVADLNATLEAEAVIFNDVKEPVFEAYFKDQPNKPKLFTSNGKELLLINK